MPKPGASEKLRELRLQMEQQDAELESALSSKPVVTKLQEGKGVVDPLEQESERKALLKRQQSSAKTQEGWPLWKTISLVGSVALVAVIVLVFLFSGNSAEYDSKSHQYGTKPLNQSEYAIQNPDHPCPENPWWIPPECIGDTRKKSKSVFEKCSKTVEENGWSMEFLQTCELI